MNPPLITSETAFYRQLLTQARKVQLQRSIVVMIICGVLQVFWLFIGTLLALKEMPSLVLFLLSSPLVFGLLTGVFAKFGFASFRRAKRPITIEEVSRLRQGERARLFRQAQGILPMAYRPWRIALDVLLGLLCATGGLACLLFSIPDTGLLKFVYATCLQCTALYLLHSALYEKPRRAREIPSESAQELKRRLTLGEVMSESEMEDRHKAV